VAATPRAHAIPRRHASLWSEFEAQLRSGCVGEACPCIEAAGAAAGGGRGGTCPRIGTRLSQLPKGWSDYATRLAGGAYH
jgi:hypothetical protein